MRRDLYDHLPRIDEGDGPTDEQLRLIRAGRPAEVKRDFTILLEFVGDDQYTIYCPEMRYEGPAVSLKRTCQIIKELITEYKEIQEL